MQHAPQKPPQNRGKCTKKPYIGTENGYIGTENGYGLTVFWGFGTRFRGDCPGFACGNRAWLAVDVRKDFQSHGKYALIWLQQE